MEARAKSPSPEPFSYEIYTDAQYLLDNPRSDISVLLLAKRPSDSIKENKIKRRRHSQNLFVPITNHEVTTDTAKKVKQTFSSPSPDDRIIEAQKQAFEENLKGLLLVEKKADVPKATKPFKNVDVAKELAQATSNKPQKSFVVIGHVDAGKSTLMGRLLYDLGVVDAKTVNKLVREAEKTGKGSFALAWVMDQTSEERARGVTVDICATEFETSTTRFTAIDAPGHKDFVPQMIGGVTQAEIALLVVDAINGEFEAGFDMDGQTKEHTLLAKNLGIEQICVAVNKLDKEEWSQARFEEIEAQLTAYLTTEVGFAASSITFVPISGLVGTNVVKRDEPKLGWYTGPTLVEYLEKVHIDNRQSDGILVEEFTLAASDIQEVTNSEFVIRGRVASGYIQAGETVKISPSLDYVQVQSIKKRGSGVDVAFRGDNVTLSFKTSGLTNKSIDDLSLGDLATRVDLAVMAVQKFSAQITLFNMNKPLLVGSPFVLFRNNSYVPARISTIVAVEGAKKIKKHLVSKQSATVEIEVQGDRALPLATFANSRVLGRVVIRREGVTVGAGQVL